jgi:hypothetical protein
MLQRIQRVRDNVKIIEEMSTMCVWTQNRPRRMGKKNSPSRELYMPAKLVETLDLVECEYPEEMLFRRLSNELDALESVAQLRAWWLRNNDAIVGLGRDHRDELVRIKDDLKLELPDELEKGITHALV